MGLLDDAIREHLDLKRRRGADPEEVARQEHEALGPVRREPAAAEATAPDAPAAAEPVAADEPAAAAEPDRLHPASEDLHPDERTHVLAPEDRHDPPHGDALLERHVDQPTTEYRVEDHHDEPLAEAAPPPALDPPPAPDPPAPDASDDVLEETPEFLQETPEHDRLWFEQRPPRDFDFDG